MRPRDIRDAEGGRASRYLRPLPAPIAHTLKFVTIGLAGFVAYASLTPTANIESISNMDKLVHALVYAGLAFIMAAGWRRSSLWFVFWVCAGFGGGLELGQAAMDLGRSGSWADQIANMLGAAIALLAWVIIITGLRAWRERSARKSS